MDDQKIIERVRHEHERLGEIKSALIAAIQHSIEDGAVKWLDDLRKAYEHFRAHLIHRIALQEIGGFLNVVIERNPTLANEVEHLRKAHAELIEHAGETMKKLRELSADSPEELKQAALLVEMSLAEVRFHEEAETLLVSFVFTQDIGEGD